MVSLSATLDGSADVTDTAQLLRFVRSVAENVMSQVPGADTAMLDARTVSRRRVRQRGRRRHREAPASVGKISEPLLYFKVAVVQNREAMSPQKIVCLMSQQHSFSQRQKTVRFTLFLTR